MQQAFPLALGIASVLLVGHAVGSSRGRNRSSLFFFAARAATDARLAVLQQPLAIEGLTSAEGDWLECLMTAHDRSSVSDLTNLASLAMPVLLIWESADTVTPLWQGRQLQRLIPRAELSILENVGHIPNIEHPAAFNQMLVDYLQRRR